jgi:hypothetical protein
LRVKARFCDECGAPVGGATEYKQVTVLFADVVRSMDLAAAADRQRGLELLAQVRGMWLREHSLRYALPLVDICVARECARRGDRDGAIPVMRNAVDELHQAGRLGLGVWGAAVLVETLLGRGTEDDVAEAEITIDQMANLPPDERWAVRDIWLLRLRALLARAHGIEDAYRDYRDRYRAMAGSLGFQGHIAMAEAMGESGA